MLRRHRYYKPKRGRIQKIKHPIREQMAGRATAGRAKKIVGALFALATTGWFAYFFLASDNFAVKSIAISGNRNIPTQELSAIIGRELGGAHFLFVPRSNILLVSKEGIQEAIRKQYLVDEITIKRALPYTLQVAVQEKLSRVVLRVITPIEIIPLPAEKEESGEEAVPPDVSHNNVTETKEAEVREVQYAESYHLLDVNGIVVKSGPASERDLAELPIIEIIRNDQSEINPGAAILNREIVELIFELYERVKMSPQAIALSHVSFDPENSRELIFKTKEGWQALISTQIPLETQLQKLELALAERIKENRKSLQYIDLRVKDRVYFK
ncbi:MAG: FtsQ-type POTRA domain-containing protein [Parcubacteria group bacterium]|nr:FtsQ-type POTRA domain-containing protein [Parcubacteria group bacterium]